MNGSFKEFLEMIFNPLEQFKVQEIFSLDTIYYTFTITNSSLYLIFATCLIIIFYTYSISFNSSIISDNKYTIISESIYKTILRLVIEQIGIKGTMYFPLIFTLFNLILVSNLIGLIPYGFSPTAQFIIPLGISITIILSVTILGFNKYGLEYFSVLCPSGSPLGLLPLMLPIELLSYIARALSLGIRLAANITAGHILLNIFSGFMFKATSFGLLRGIFIIFIPFIAFIALMGLELMVAILQAYV